MKRIVSILICLVTVLSLSFTVFAIDKEDTYTLNNGTKTTYSTKMCFLFKEEGSHIPVYSGGSYSGCKCINQLTYSTPTSGTNITYATYTNNDTQRFYQFKVVATGYTSYGYCPVNNIQISINRRRILPSYANMITTVGNTYGDFNVQAGSCVGNVGLLIDSVNGLFVLEHQGGAYPCGPTELYLNASDNYLKWMDLNVAAINEDYRTILQNFGTIVYQMKSSGGQVGTCICTRVLCYNDI